MTDTTLQGAKAAQKRARNDKKAGTKAVSQLKTVRIRPGCRDKTPGD